MEYKIEARSNIRRKFLSAIMPSMIRQLNLENSKKVVVVRVENDCEGMGFTIPVDCLDGYIVVIKPASLESMAETLAHEMVHVRQMARGLLKSDGKGNHFWCGKKYSKKTKYLDMPWELDAFSKQEIILRKAIEE
jgi:hypothetical protein